MIKFFSEVVRDSVWYAKAGFKGTGITISEFLTKQRHRVFIAARERFGISNCWTKLGRIVIMDYDGKRHTIESVGDIEKIKACSPRVSPEASGSDKPTTYVVGNKKKRAPSAKRNKLPNRSRVAKKQETITKFKIFR
ncbi:hypothetical protein ACJJTC_006940 [Scirpophaga incertulas]